jgi:cytochrome c oxidase subunit 3
VLDPLHLPLYNTVILLLSGTTVTWAHHALLHGDRKGLIWGLTLTIVLGMIFSSVQAYEYAHAPFLQGSLYGATFFMATGFHGFHVLVGTIFLIVCLIRAMPGHFTPKQHFGFEAAAWYWHFVDVVWLFLFFASMSGHPGVRRFTTTRTHSTSCRRGRRGNLPPLAFEPGAKSR